MIPGRRMNFFFSFGVNWIRCDASQRGTTGNGNMAEWLRRLIRNQLEAIPREFESLCCRVFVKGLRLFFLVQNRFFTHYGIESASHFISKQVLVAQRIAHQTSNLGVAGSNPVEHVFQ